MGIVFRQSIKSTIAISAGALLGALTIYLSTHFIPKQELGFRQNITNQAVVAGQILLLGLHNMLSVYVHKYGDTDKRKHALLSISLVLPFLFIGLASLFYFVFRGFVIGLFMPADQLFISRYFVWLPLFVLLFAYNVVLEAYLISQMKVAKATFIREVLLRGLNLILILLFGFKYISFDVLIYGTVLVYFIPLFLLAGIAAKTEAFKLSFRWKVFEVAERKEIVHFTWYHSLLSVSITFMGMLDALMLPVLSPAGLRSVPIYTVAIFIISFLLIPYKAMLSSTFPVLAQAFNAEDGAKVKDVFLRSSMNIFIASAAMFLLISCNLHNAVVLLPPGYEAIAPVVLILSLGRMMDMATGMNDQVLSISRHYKYNFYISLLLVIMIVVLNWWLIPLYDVYGAAWGTSIALVIYNFIKYFIVKQKLQITPFTPKTLIVVLIAGIVYAIGYFLPRLSNPFIDAAYRSTVILIAYGGLLFLFRASDDLNNYVRSIKTNKRLF
jgi:O-antigen/teichoic acid export membrane protein